MNMVEQGRKTVEISIGSVLGDYRLEELLETGEAGQVFLASHRNSNESFRLRVLAVPSDLDAEARMLYLGHFQKQANQLTALQHVRILPLLSYGTNQGRPYLVYQNYPMQSLSRYVARHGPLNAPTAGFFLDQIAEALEYGHQHGILHRNLSAECVFIQQDGSLVVADLGVQRMLESGARHPKSDAGHDLVFGMNQASSPAPEQLLGGAIDATVDVYALGATLYRMLTGHRVFRGKTGKEIAQQHLHAPVPRLNVWRHDLPATLDNVIATAMAKDPRQRFKRPGELANAYSQVVAPHDSKRRPFEAAPVPVLAPVSKRPPVLREEPHRQAGIPRRKALTLLVAGGSAAAIVTVVSVVGIRLLQGNPTALVPSPNSGASTPGKGGGSTPVTRHGTLLAHVSDVPVNSDKLFALPNSRNPGLLIHLPDKRFVAFDSTCTHAGCAVTYNPQNSLLHCPCHDAVFNPAKGAAVVQGPAQTPLTAIPISINADGSITTNSF
jgi:serine/threonine-protein kinase